MAKGTLNLVFHGFHIFGGVEKGASILAVAPKVDSHVYLAGAWMDERPVEGDYEVTIPGWKAPGQPADFDARCLAVDTPVCKIPLEFLRYSVKVPQPSQIFTEAFAQLQENIFNGTRMLQPLRRPVTDCLPSLYSSTETSPSWRMSALESLARPETKGLKSLSLGGVIS